MYVRPTLVPDARTSEFVEPGQGTLHHPPMNPQTAAMLGQTLSQDGLDPHETQGLLMGLRTIGSVSLNPFWSTTGPTTPIDSSENPVERNSLTSDSDCCSSLITATMKFSGR